MNSFKCLVGPTDHFDPETRAMLMAKYSRDVGPIESRLPSSQESIQQHQTAMGTYYVGYGHKSVGQLADTSIFFEGVSQLAAKALEHHPLYNGQESSTRYIDYTHQPFVSPTTDIAAWQSRFRAFYLRALGSTIAHLKVQFPYASQPPETKTTVYEKTITARAFDICRGFLPAGVTTNVGFKGTFDTLNEHLGKMLFHPLEELRQIAKTAIQTLGARYKYAAMSEDKLRGMYKFVDDNFWLNTDLSPALLTPPSVILMRGSRHKTAIAALLSRNKYDEMPRFVGKDLRLQLTGSLDFGSYRDLHRHRNGYINMPLLGTSLGFEASFHHFYLHSLADDMRAEASTLLGEFDIWFRNSPASKLEKQYAVPMGYRVEVEYDCDINQALYIFELRSGKTSHQTLRSLIQWWACELERQIPGARVFIDRDTDNFTLKRGEQTF
jgi:thymidylate synthase ThyX